MQKHVLVVDDETTILLAFKKLLQTPRVYVDTAESMEDVKILLTDKYYDAVIADLRLSGVSGEEGLEVIRFVKERNPETKCILITAFGNQEVMSRAYNLGRLFISRSLFQPMLLKTH